MGFPEILFQFIFSTFLQLEIPSMCEHNRKMKQG